MSDLTLENVDQRVRKLPSLSQVVIEILHSFDNENIDTATLVNEIGCDQGLTTSVLRVANSAFFGMTNRIDSISEAVVVLGFHNIRSLVVAAGVINQFPAGEGQVFDRGEFWRHSIGTGACAKVLAMRLGNDPEVAFTAGLLHDIGVLVLDAYFHEDFKRALAYCSDRDCTFVQAEEAVLNLSHATIGFEVARQWNFPLPLQQAIRDHHLPNSGEPAVLTDTVHLADVLCHALEIGKTSNNLVPPLSAGTWTRLGLEWSDIGTMFGEIERLNATIHLLLE